MTKRKTTKKALPGKGVRNRLTDMRCGWRHATDDQRADFLRWVADEISGSTDNCDLLDAGWGLVRAFDPGYLRP